MQAKFHRENFMFRNMKQHKMAFQIILRQLDILSIFLRLGDNLERV